ERSLTAVHPLPAGTLDLKEESTDLARGEHLVRAVLSCTLCHGPDLGGSGCAAMGAVGVIAGPTLPRGRGGIGATFTRADWVRAIRYGVRADGTSLIAMPSEVFTNLTNADLAAVILYVSRGVPVRRHVHKRARRP